MGSFPSASAIPAQTRAPREPRARVFKNPAAAAVENSDSSRTLSRARRRYGEHEYARALARRELVTTLQRRGNEARRTRPERRAPALRRRDLDLPAQDDE